MTALAAEFFTLDEVNRLKIIQDVIDRRLTTQMAAHRLGISDRQCRRLLARYREDGPLGMTSRRRGKSSNNQLPQGLAAYALNIIRERYNDFGPTLACEKLSEVHGVHLSKETVRKLMTQASLWVPRKQRAPKIQQPRYRRACAGELIQIDGCDHHWFENRGPGGVPMVTARGRASGDAFYAVTAIELARQLPCPCVEFSGHHLSYAMEPVVFANELHQILVSLIK